MLGRDLGLTRLGALAIGSGRGPEKVASNAKRTTAKRTRKQRTAGRRRKKVLERNGTTNSEHALFGNTLSPSKD